MPQASKVFRGHSLGNMPLPNLTTIKVSTKERAIPSQANGPSLLTMSFWPVSMKMYLQGHVRHEQQTIFCELSSVIAKLERLKLMWLNTPDYRPPDRHSCELHEGVDHCINGAA